MTSIGTSFGTTWNHLAGHLGTGGVPYMGTTVFRAAATDQQRARVGRTTRLQTAMDVIVSVAFTGTVGLSPLCSL